MRFGSHSGGLYQTFATDMVRNHLKTLYIALSGTYVTTESEAGRSHKWHIHNSPWANIELWRHFHKKTNDKYMWHMCAFKKAMHSFSKGMNSSCSWILICMLSLDGLQLRVNFWWDQYSMHRTVSWYVTQPHFFSQCVRMYFYFYVYLHES